MRSKVGSEPRPQTKSPRTEPPRIKHPHSAIVRSYYVDLGHKDVRTGMYDPFVFDEAGIPQYPYGDELHYNVTFVCHYALYQLSLYQKFGRADALDVFLRVSRWLAEHGDETSDSFTFPYQFDIPDLKAPWLSALGQGRLLSVFTRAFEATEDSRLLDLARKSMRPFEDSVEEGGVRTTFDDGGVAFEEYPRRHRNVVLNGLITALFGIYDLAAAGDERARALFDEAVASLARNLHRYDLGYWSAYDLTGPLRRVAGDEYHAYHVALLWALYEMTGIGEFKRTAGRWEAYRKTPRLHLFRTLSRVQTKMKYR